MLSCFPLQIIFCPDIGTPDGSQSNRPHEIVVLNLLKIILHILAPITVYMCFLFSLLTLAWPLPPPVRSRSLSARAPREVSCSSTWGGPPRWWTIQAPPTRPTHQVVGSNVVLHPDLQPGHPGTPVVSETVRFRGESRLLGRQQLTELRLPRSSVLFKRFLVQNIRGVSRHWSHEVFMMKIWLSPRPFIKSGT